MVSSSLLSKDLANESRFQAFIDPQCHEVIHDSVLPLKYKNRYYERFRLGPPYVAAQDWALMHQKLIELSTKIQFNLASGLFETRTDSTFTQSEGVTYPATPWHGTICNLSYQLLEPLIYPTCQKVSPAEKMLCHFNLVTALLHEFTVSYYPWKAPSLINVACSVGQSATSRAS